VVIIDTRSAGLKVIFAICFQFLSRQNFGAKGLALVLLDVL